MPFIGFDSNLPYGLEFMTGLGAFTGRKRSAVSKAMRLFTRPAVRQWIVQAWPWRLDLDLHAKFGWRSNS
jgi:hypothetical protein